MIRPVMMALVVVATIAVGRANAAGITGACASKDERSDRLIAELKAFVGKTDLGGMVEKTTMGLKDVTPSQVSLITDKALCSKAATAFDKQLLEKRSSYTLYVVSLGSSYAVEDTKMLQPGWETADVYDGNWKYIGVRQIHSSNER